jgi:hypothetical protein
MFCVVAARVQQKNNQDWKALADWLKQLYAHGLSALAGSSNFTRMDCPRWLAQATLCAWIVLAGWLKQLYAHGLSSLAGSSNFMRMDCPRWLAQVTLCAWIVLAGWLK